MTGTYFFDTYAIIDILKGNSAYDEYKNAEIVLTIFNLIELHYKILNEFDEKLAREMLEKYSKFKVEINLDIIEESNKFKKIHKKRKMSVPDVIGYIMAKKLGIKFLTGDKEFENFDNVEFVK